MCALLASVEKAGYFPCPTIVVQTLVLRHIRVHPWAVASTYILDPCAGEGSAVHTFAQALARLPISTTAAHYADRAVQCQRRIHVRGVEKNRLLKQERSISFEEVVFHLDAGELRRSADAGELLKHHQEYAAATLRRDARVNVRLTSRDSSRLNKRALEQGIPYKALASSILHQYVEGALRESS